MAAGAGDDPEDEAGVLRHRGAGWFGAEPADAEADHDQGEEEDGDADGLEEGVRGVGADHAGPVVSGTAGGVSAGGVEGGVGWGVADKGEQEETGGDEDDHAEDLVEATIAGWRRVESEWLHIVLVPVPVVLAGSGRMPEYP